jgi:hypothetical protein
MNYSYYANTSSSLRIAAKVMSKEGLYYWVKMIIGNYIFMIIGTPAFKEVNIVATTEDMCSLFMDQPGIQHPSSILWGLYQNLLNGH